MKITKYTMLVSSVLFLVLAAICFFESLFVDIDAYDFAAIFASLRPARIFLATSVIIFVWFIFLYKKLNQNFNVEKVFALFVALLFVSFGYSYYARTNGNNVAMQTAHSYDYKIFELNKNYLPFYVYSEDEKADYEIFKGDAKGTTMVYVASEILSENGNMQYEAEFLNTNNLILYYKYLLSKTMFEDTPITIGRLKDTFILEDKEIEVFTYENSYAICIAERNKVFYVTLSNVKNISTEEFAQKVVEQLKVMNETIEKDRLLENNTVSTSVS